MATEIWTVKAGEGRASSTASGGTALSTTLVTLGFPLNTKLVTLVPRNFAGAAVMRYSFNPWLTVIKTQDAFLSPGTDYSNAAQDADTNTDVNLDALSTLVNGDALWVGSHVPFRGLSVDVDTVNAVGNTLAAVYWNGSALTSLSITDNTDTGASLAQDGTITWTVPAPWRSASLNAIRAAVGGNVTPYNGTCYEAPLYWLRFDWSVALTASTSLNSLHALNRSTAYEETVSTLGVQKRIEHGFGGVGCVELLTDAGTANVIVNCEVAGGGVFA